MHPAIIHKLTILQKRFYKLKQSIEYANVINDYQRLNTLSKEYSKSINIITCFEKWLSMQQTISYTKEMLSDVEMYEIVQDELKKLCVNKDALEEKLKILLSTEDFHDKCGCFIELRAGTGGKEAAIFTGELFRMYVRYLEIKRWHMEIIQYTYGEFGGYKEVVVKVFHRGAYGKLKFESGGHRVQRIPYTESQGRIHTSTCTVAVIPEIPNNISFHINTNDLRIDTFRASGAGGQHVNTTDSAIRITHIPSGLSVACQDERSQHKNKAKALAVLSARLYAINMQQRQKEESDIRRTLVGTGYRSDRIRTYNFQHSRITDHRISFTSHKLTDIMNGKLDIIIDSIIHHNNMIWLDKLLVCT